MRDIFHMTSGVRIPACFSASVSALSIASGSGRCRCSPPPVQAASDMAAIDIMNSFFILFR